MKNNKLRTLALNASTLTLIALASASLTLLQGCSGARSQKPATDVQQPPQREVKVGNKVTNESTIACNMAVLSDEQRKRIMVLIKQIRTAGQEVRELADGYSFRLPAESAMIRDVSEWITLERLCCPFFRFEMEVEPEGGAMWVRLTGREGVKEFTKLELGLQGTAR